MSRARSGIPLLLCSFGLIVAASPVRAAPAPRRLSLSQAVALASRQSYDVKIAKASLLGAEARRRGSLHLWAPRLEVSGNLLFWDSDLPFEMDIDWNAVEIPDGCFLPEPCLGMFDSLMGSLGVIREQFTAQLQVRLVQPLTPLFQVYKVNQISRLGVDMEQTKIKATQQKLRFEVTQAYLQVYQARTMLGIMKDAEDLVKAHEARITKLLAEEMVRKAELLKVKVKAAEVTQGVIQSRAAIDLATSNLARTMGLSIDAPLVLTERFPDPPPPYHASLRQCIDRALKNRQEIKMTRIGQAQARAGRAAKRWDLVPTVAAVAQYEANHGMGTLMRKHSFFVGAVLKWEFNWGRKVREADEITAKLRKAELLELKARSGIPLEVKKVYLDLRVARQTLTVARAAVAAATESHRIQIKRFELRAGSTTDVLDAQMELTKAKAMYANGLYKYYIARAALDRAMGVVQ